MKIPVLDHGYVELVESWGSDERIIESARMSTAKGFKGWGPNPCPDCPDSRGSVLVKLEEGWLGDGKGEAREDLCPCPRCKGTGKVPGDEGLLRHLWENRHHTPFEMAGMIIEVQAPIFVFREWHRHRTQSYNELSARYTQLPDLYYVPSLERLKAAKQDTKDKQGSVEGFNDAAALAFRKVIAESHARTRSDYEYLLDLGIAREVARVVVPVAQYSRMRASSVLRNWFHFLSLRLDKHAQWEIRQYANIVGSLVQELFPKSWELFAGGLGPKPPEDTKQSQ